MSADLSTIPLSELLAELDRRTADLRASAAQEERRKYDRERQRDYRANKAADRVQPGLLSQRARRNVTAVVTGKPVTPEEHVTNLSQPKSENVTAGAAAAPQVPPHPPSSPAPPHVPTPTRGTPPTVEEVRQYVANAILPIPPAERDEFAQAYVDHRSRTDPPWHLPPTNNRPAQAINLAEWRGDVRRFASNWREVEHERAARRQTMNGHAKPRAEPDTTPLPVDPALWRRFVTDPAFPEYRNLADQPAPKTEADISRFVIEDWKNFKRRQRKAP